MYAIEIKSKKEAESNVDASLYADAFTGVGPVADQQLLANAGRCHGVPTVPVSRKLFC